MMQIKTVIKQLSEHKQFDEEVNILLGSGWKLKKREITKIKGLPSEAFNFSPEVILYAELERSALPYPEEVTL